MVGTRSESETPATRTALTKTWEQEHLGRVRGKNAASRSGGARGDRRRSSPEHEKSNDCRHHPTDRADAGPGHGQSVVTPA